MFQNIVYRLLAGIVLLASCTKDKPRPRDGGLPTINTRKVLINGEGSLGNGNANLSVYLPETDSVYQNVFWEANHQHLGDVFQSITRIKDCYYLCINNSDKIEVIDTGNWVRKTSIPVSKPRNLLKINDHKAYVGSLFSNKIYIINTDIGQVSASISMPYQNVEAMVQYQGKVYASCWDTACNYLYIINPETDAIEDSILLAGKAGNSILMDKEEQIWVLAGNTYKNCNASFSRIDPVSRSLKRSFVFSPGIEAVKACTNPQADSIYFIEVNYSGATENNGIYRFPIHIDQLPKQAFIQADNFQYFWALGIDPHSGHIYIGDPKGFVQKSEVSVFLPQGDKIHRFTTGLGVGSFYFD